MLVNAGGPWVADVLRQKLGQNSRENVRLVRGSHIVVPKLYDHGRCYFFQGQDGRIIFAIPYEEDFTLIGTTDADHPDPETKPICTEEEQASCCKKSCSPLQQRNCDRPDALTEPKREGWCVRF